MILPLKTFTVEQNLLSWSLDMSLPSSQVASLLNKANFPFQPTLVSQVLAFEWRAAQLELSRALWGSQAWRPFCPPFLVGKTPSSMTFPEFQRAELNSCSSREEQPKKPTEARLKGPEKLVKIRSPTT